MPKLGAFAFTISDTLSRRQLIEQSESLAYVKDQCGHSSITVTVDTYGHLVPGGNRQAVDKLDERVIVNAEKETPANGITESLETESGNNSTEIG